MVRDFQGLISTLSIPAGSVQRWAGSLGSHLWLGEVVASALTGGRAGWVCSPCCAPACPCSVPACPCSPQCHSSPCRAGGRGWRRCPFPGHSPRCRRCERNANGPPLTGLLSFVCWSSCLRMTILIMFALCMMKVTFLTDFAGLEV